MRKFLLSFPVTYCIIKRCVVLFNISFYTLRSVPRILSPVINHLLFAMPAAAVLPAILIKSGLLAGTAALAARYAKNISLLALLGVILSYQIIGTAFEWALCGNFFLAVQDFRMGIPGMLIQWFGGYALLKAIAKK